MNDSNEALLNQPPKLLCILCYFHVKYIKIESRISMVYAFFHKKKAQCYSLTRSFANVLYLSICMLGNCSCFYFRLLTFFKIRVFFTNKPPGITIGVSNSLDPDQDQCSDGLHLGSNCLQKVIGRRQNSPLECKELNQVNTLVFNILSNIGSFQLRYTCICIS